MRSPRSIIIVAALFAMPFIAFAQTDTSAITTVNANALNGSTVDYSGTYAFQKDGVFGCNLNGAYSMSVGALSATGGAYVPVNDAAVTLNTGYLVYKECVLRGIVDRMREGATSGITKQVTVSYTSGRNGQPYYSQNLTLEQRASYANSVVAALQGSTLSGVSPAFQAAIKRGIAQGFSQSLNAPNQSLACSYTGNLQSMEQSPTKSFSWAGLFALTNQNCIPYFAAMNANALVMNNAATIWNNQATQLGWGRGTYPVQGLDDDGNVITLTPGDMVAANAQLALQTGFVQLQNANDIDQMVGALFAGITSQVIGDNRGLAGLTQTTGSQPSYLDQVASESAAGLRSSALNAAITILGANQQVEQGYLAAMQAIGSVLTNTITSLRTKENTCWNAVIQNVCAAGTLKSDNTCTAVSSGCTTDENGNQSCPTGVALKVATSTAFSQAIVSSQITPLASSTLDNITASQAALTLINQLVVAVSNTTSLDSQRIALQQLDTLVSQHKLHTQYDAQAAVQSKTDVTNSMTTLLSDTVANWTGGGSDGTANAAWDGTTYPAVGWCNVSNQTTIQAWIQKWKQ